MLALIYWQESPILGKQYTQVNVHSCKALRIEYTHPLVEFLHSGVQALSNPHISSHRWMICKDNNPRHRSQVTVKAVSIAIITLYAPPMQLLYRVLGLELLFVENY